MELKLVTVGKTDVKWVKEGLDLYVSRLRHSVPFSLVEIPQLKNVSALTQEQIKEKEGERLISKMKDGCYCIALAIKGKKLTSEGLAKKIEDLGTGGVGHIAFVIGGSLGLSDTVLNKCDIQLSFSDMTFPHQLMRVILLEQVYRAYRIISNEPYHK